MVIYNLALVVLKFLVTLGSLFHKKLGLQQKGINNSWNILKRISKEENIIWFHVSSLGEFEQGRTTIEKIKREKPDYKILLTFFSPSGYEIRKNYEFADYICYLPIDTKANAKRFLALANPKIAVFVKYDFWLNYLYQLHKLEVPTYIISTLFRENQIFFKPYGKIFYKALTFFKCIFTQNQVSKEILEKNGITNVQVAGDNRIDRVFEMRANLKEFPEIEKFAKGKTTIVCGSTWEPDEGILCQYINEHKESDLRFIIAPHEVHKAHVKQICDKLEVEYIKYSEIEKIEPKHKLIIVDCIGILSSIYKYAQVAYIGGGFGVSIHNTLEPATYDLPIIFGPKYHKFEEAVRMVERKGAFSVGSYQEFETVFTDLRTNYETAGKNAGQYIKDNVGATEVVFNQMFLNN